MAVISARGIDDQVVNEFKSLVRMKYGKLHTVYGLEIEKALENHLKLLESEVEKKSGKI